MSDPGHNEPFFIGWSSRVPGSLVVFLCVVAAALIGGGASLAFTTSATINDPGNGRFEWGMGQQQMAGVLRTQPYPVLRLPAGADGTPPQAVLLAGQGKRGVQVRAAPLDGTVVEASGILLKRGSIDMLQVGGKIGLRATENEVDPAAGRYEPPPATELGRWRMAGEVCDGKCYQGAMRPGRGLAHKACANLCLIGGAPPVFVTSSPVDGTTFFLMAGPDGGPLGDELLDLTGLWISVEGTLSRIDNLHIFAIDPNSISAK
jgi:hypothetical protein